MNKWEKIKLGDIANFSNGKKRPDEDGSIPIYGGNGILGFTSKSNIENETIIVGRVGAYCGSVYYENRPIWVSDNALHVKPKKNIDTKFLYYFLISTRLNQHASGSSHPLLTQSLLNSLKYNFCVKFNTQKAIAEVLSSLDDKINLLHRQNKTLENLAQTLFRQYFIEEANDEWEEKSLSEIADFLNGLACQKFPPKNGKDKLHVLKIKELKEGISDNSDWVTSDVKPEYIVKNGDIIFAWSASLMVKIWDGEDCILNQHLFKVTSKNYPKWFYYQWCKYHLNKFISIAQAHATTMGHIKRKDLDNAMCLVLSIDKLKNFDTMMSKLLKKQEINARQIKTLENLRDTLLPKLMNGEVRIKI